MPFASALSVASSTSVAVSQVCEQLSSRMNGPIDLLIAFFSPSHLRQAEALSQQLQTRLEPKLLMGCVGETVINDDREIEEGSALSLFAVRWAKQVEMTPLELSYERTSDGATLLGCPDRLSGLDSPPPAAQRSGLLLLGDPFSFPTDLFLGRMNEDSPGIPVLGGMASGINAPGMCRLLLNGRVVTHGAIGVLLEGDIGLRWIVSQGCRPIGRPYVVTRAEENVIYELGGRPPMEVLQELWPTLSPREQELFQRGLHLGRVLNEYQGEFRRGDFLIRNVMGLERGSGALIVGDRVRVGQTVQFQVRDGGSADEDLRDLLQLDRQGFPTTPSAALLFSCNGRGTRLFEQPDHDARAIRQALGPIPLAGFFAMGELGPVTGQNFIHGFTASVAVFEEN